MNAMRLRGVILLLYYVERLINLMPVINERLVKFSPYQHLFDPVWVRPCNSKNEHCTTVLPSSLTIYLNLSGKKLNCHFEHNLFLVSLRHSESGSLFITWY